MSEWAVEPDAEKLERVACLVSPAHRGFVFAQEEFVIDLLRQANAISEACLQNVGGSLYRCAITGSYSGTPGQPMPSILMMQEQARHIKGRLQNGSPEYRFYQSLEKHFSTTIRDQLATDAEIED